MKDIIINKLKNYRIVIVMLLIGLVLWPINRNMASILSIYTGLFIVFIVSFVSLFGKKAADGDVDGSSVLIVMVYGFFLLVPTLSLYCDLPDFFSNNWSVEEGTIEDSYRYRGYLDVYINDKTISFWDPTVSNSDFPGDSTMKIYYLPRSKQGVAYEIVKD